MNTQLRLGNYYIDLSEDINIETSFNFSDIENPAEKGSAYSKTITIPSTQNNDEALGFLFDFGAQVTTFDPSVKVLAEVVTNGIPKFTGVGQLLAIKILNNIVSYELGIYGEAASLFRDIDSKDLTDLDFSDDSPEWIAEIVTDAWDRLEANDFTQPYTFPLVDLGQIPSAERENNPASALYTTDMFYPALSIRHIIDKIFSDAGYTYQCPFFQANSFNHLFIPYPSDALPKKANADIYATQFYINSSASYTGAIPDMDDGGYLYPVYDDATAPTYFNGGSYDMPNNEYVAAIAGSYEFNYLMVIDGGLYDDDAAQFKIVLEVNAVDADFQLHDITNLVAGGVSFTIQPDRYLSGKFTITLAAGDVVKFKIQDTTTPFGGWANLLSTQISGQTLVNTISVGETFNLNGCLPVGVKQGDFLRSIFKDFNLLPETDKNNPKNIIIDTYDDFYSSGNLLNWDDKLDISKEITIEPSGALTKKRFIYSHARGGGYFDKLYSNSYSESYSNRDFTNASDFASDAEEHKSILGAPVVVGYGNSSRLIPRFYDFENGNLKKIAAGLRFVYADYISYPVTAGFFVFNGDPLDKYPYAGHLDNPYNPTIDFNFGIPRELYYTNTTENPNLFNYTNNNTFNRLHRNRLNNIINPNAKLVRAYFLLDDIDINTFSFRNKVYFQGQRWLVQNINNIDNVNLQSTEVELLLDLPLGAFTPTTFAVVDGAGANLDGEWLPKLSPPTATTNPE